MRFIEAVEILDVLRFAVEVEGVRAGRLHPISKFIAFNARGKFGFIRLPTQVFPIQLGEKIKLRPLGFGRHRGRTLQVVNRCSLRFEPRALKGSRQKPRAPIGRMAFRQATV